MRAKMRLFICCLHYFRSHTPKAGLCNFSANHFFYGHRLVQVIISILKRFQLLFRAAGKQTVKLAANLTIYKRFSVKIIWLGRGLVSSRKSGTISTICVIWPLSWPINLRLDEP